MSDDVDRVHTVIADGQLLRAVNEALRERFGLDLDACVHAQALRSRRGSTG